MTALNLDELERLLAEAKQDRDNKIMQSFSLYGTKAEIVLSDAAVRALPALIAAARERASLIESNSILRKQAVEMAEERDALRAELDISKSFYDLTIVERNYERVVNDRLKADNERLRAKLEEQKQ